MSSQYSELQTKFRKKVSLAPSSKVLGSAKPSFYQSFTDIHLLITVSRQSLNKYLQPENRRDAF